MGRLETKSYSSSKNLAGRPARRRQIALRSSERSRCLKMLLTLKFEKLLGCLMDKILFSSRNVFLGNHNLHGACCHVLHQTVHVVGLSRGRYRGMQVCAELYAVDRRSVYYACIWCARH